MILIVALQVILCACSQHAKLFAQKDLPPDLCVVGRGFRANNEIVVLKAAPNVTKGDSLPGKEFFVWCNSHHVIWLQQVGSLKFVENSSDIATSPIVVFRNQVDKTKAWATALRGILPMPNLVVGFPRGEEWCSSTLRPHGAAAMRPSEPFEMNSVPWRDAALSNVSRIGLSAALEHFVVPSHATLLGSSSKEGCKLMLIRAPDRWKLADARKWCWTHGLAFMLSVGQERVNDPSQLKDIMIPGIDTWGWADAYLDGTGENVQGMVVGFKSQPE